MSATTECWRLVQVLHFFVLPTSWRLPVKRFFLSALAVLSTFAAATAQELTIQSIYAPAGLTGRVPDTIEWSPDAKKVSYFLHQEQGDKADLY